ncbi:DUF494 domain-containing protein [Acidithiobacillus acidisediminis]|jgi:Smg protein|uniref:DUF494 domain-containing protein n=1 Tax=Acidithiobacillus TaxID=119977 RepID=UPI00200E8620|nr:DUF494 domain-containing protein [Acidithiobacillus sp. S30A2]
MEDVIDIISYLLDHLDDEDENSEIEDQLRAAGYPEEGIQRALDWMDGFDEDHSPENSLAAVRSYQPWESLQLSLATRGQLAEWEHLGVINSSIRERIIDRLLALELEETDLETLDWVAFLVMVNEDGPEGYWMDQLLSPDGQRILH